MCDKRVSAKMKGKVHKTVVMQMMYGLETVALRKTASRVRVRDENVEVLSGSDKDGQD